MNANVSKLLNEQINKEFYSAYLYLDFANYYASVGLDGFENWYRVQAQEERDHAMLFYQYLQNNGEGVTFEAIAKPEWERDDHMTPLKKALAHERLVTAGIDVARQFFCETRTEFLRKNSPFLRTKSETRSLASKATKTYRLLMQSSGNLTLREER